MINFVVVENKVRFDVAPPPSESDNLKISTRCSESRAKSCRDRHEAARAALVEAEAAGMMLLTTLVALVVALAR